MNQISLLLVPIFLYGIIFGKVTQSWSWACRQKVLANIPECLIYATLLWPQYKVNNKCDLFECTFVVETMKLKLIEVKSLNNGHTGSSWQDLISDLTPKFIIFWLFYVIEESSHDWGLKKLEFTFCLVTACQSSISNEYVKVSVL